MKNKTIKFGNVVFGLLILLTFTTLIFQWSSTNKKITSTWEKNESAEAIPNDWHFRQRAYPSGRIDHTAYFSALKYQKNSATTALRNNDNPWTFAGPTNIGGRITDIEMTTDSNPRIYAAAASGGIFQSDDGGDSWTPIFDELPTLSIGDLAIAPSNQQVVYVGTGESNAGGGSLAYDGNGVYKTNDGGNSWTHLGLENIGSVGKVLVHPQNSNQCYVAAMGYLFENNPSRGVYKTNDGGNTWEQKLFINDSTGVVDLAIHPDHPDTIYAAAWQRVRRVNRRMYGGPSSGIYRSYDGGETWLKLTNGLPTSTGRIGLAISSSNPNILYATSTHPEFENLQGIYKSTDHGSTWTTVNKDGIIDPPFMWWFGKIFVDPNNADVVYLTSLNMHKSIDGGDSWTTIFADAHVDQHALCIDPQNTDRIIAGNDGGLYRSEDGGASHEKIEGLPITQFYTCEIDPTIPSRLYGGTQDNGTWRTLTGNLDDWEFLTGGDGFRTLVDPDDNSFIYAEAQFGNLFRSTDSGNSFNLATSGIDLNDRRNWNTPVVFDPNDPSIMYYGANRLYRSSNRAMTWLAISPDLSGNPLQNNLVYGTITSIAVSAIDGGVIWTGLDNGRIQMTDDGGNSWNLVSSNLPDRWVTGLVADPNDVNTAYVCLSGYRFGSQTGHVYKTTDLGNTWQDISGDLPDIPVNDLIYAASTNMLYLASDIGVFFSKNDGLNWELLGTDLPNLVITDIDYHASTNVLVAGSYGRGMYKIDLEEVVSVKDKAKQEWITSVFPNPFSTVLNLNLDITAAGIYQISILNAAGKTVKQLPARFLSNGSHDFKIDGTSFPTGTYFCYIHAVKTSRQDQIQIIKH